MVYPCPYCSDDCKKYARFRAHIGRKKECREKHERRLRQLAAIAHRRYTPIERARRTLARPRRPNETPIASSSTPTDCPNDSGTKETPDSVGANDPNNPNDAGHNVEPMDDVRYEERNQPLDHSATHSADEPMSDEPASDEFQHNRPSFHNPPPSTPPLPSPLPPPQPTTHGYATVTSRLNPTSSSNPPDNTPPAGESDQSNPLQDPEWFELGEWLAHLPISNAQRARYFEFRRVSAHYSCVFAQLTIYSISTKKDYHGKILLSFRAMLTPSRMALTGPTNR
jgi:hypothetical protein